MRKQLHRTHAIAAALLLALATTSASAAPPIIKNVVEIPIHLGVNHIENFTADGRPADITEVWRVNFNAHGYHLILITTNMGVAGFEYDIKNRFWTSDTIRDEPFIQGATVTSVRFAHALVNGHPATVMLTATRHWKHTFWDETPVEFVIYQLSERGECCGTADFFKTIAVETSKERYVSAEEAIAKRFDLANPNPATE